MAKTVRYVNTSSGVNVRDAAAGNKVRSLLQGTLMIYDTANAPVKKALNGTTYTWIKVTYYYKGSNDQYLMATEATGWVTQNNTTEVSTTIPDKSSIYSGNQSYKQNERLVMRGTSSTICALFPPASVGASMPSVLRWVTWRLKAALLLASGRC